MSNFRKNSTKETGSKDMAGDELQMSQNPMHNIIWPS